MNYIDTTNGSLGVGLLTLLVVFIAVKYALTNYYSEQDGNMSETQTIIYSAISASCLALLFMILYKQSLIYKGNRSALCEEFYD